MNQQLRVGDLGRGPPSAAVSGGQADRALPELWHFLGCFRKQWMLTAVAKLMVRVLCHTLCAAVSHALQGTAASGQQMCFAVSGCCPVGLFSVEAAAQAK